MVPGIITLYNNGLYLSTYSYSLQYISTFDYDKEMEELKHANKSIIQFHFFMI